MISVTSRPVHHSTFDDFLDYCAMDNALLPSSSSLSNINASLESDLSSQLQSLLEAQVGSVPPAAVSTPFSASSRSSSAECTQLSRLNFDDASGAGGDDQLAHFTGVFPGTAASAMSQPQQFLSAEHLGVYAKLQEQGSAFSSPENPLSARTVSKSFKYPGIADNSSSGSPHHSPFSSSAFTTLSPPASGSRHDRCSLTTPPPVAMTTMSTASHRSPPCSAPPASATLYHHDNSMAAVASSAAAAVASSSATAVMSSFPCGPYSPPDFLSDTSDTAPSSVGRSDVSGLEHEMLHPRVLDKKESAQFRKIRSARREVKRLKLQKEAFQRLSHLLPCDTRRMSRLDLLRRTTEYIHELQLALEEQKRQKN